MHPTFNELLRKVIQQSIELHFSTSHLQVLIAQIQALSLSHQPKGTLVCVEGPRFSTRAESDLFRSWGAHVVGMTTHPEVWHSNSKKLWIGL
jgi:5'-methylthioadenosine phosphorylase